MIERREFRPEDLVSFGQPPPDTTPLVIGDWCVMVSGGPPMLVVDADGEALCVSWMEAGKAQEATLSRPCLRRTVAGVGRCTECQKVAVGDNRCECSRKGRESR